MTTITALPTPPQTNTDQTTFDARGDALLAALPVFVTQTNAVAGEVNTAAGAAATSQGAAATSQSAAAASETAALNSKTAAATSATNALTSQNAASASAASAAAIAGAFVGTSATSLTIGTGSKTFATQTGEQYTAGVFLSAVSVANAANYMFGQVTTYNSSTGALVMDIQVVGGSGTFADWNISLVGARGATGIPGAGVTPQAVGFIASGGTAAKTLTVDENFSVSTLLAGGYTKTLNGNSIIGSGNLALGAAPIYKNADFNASSGVSYLVDTSAGPVNATLPATPATGDTIVFADAKGTFGTNNLTLLRNGSNYLDPLGVSTAEDLILDVSGLQITQFFDTANWRIA